MGTVVSSDADGDGELTCGLHSSPAFLGALAIAVIVVAVGSGDGVVGGKGCGEWRGDEWRVAAIDVSIAKHRYVVLISFLKCSGYLM